MAPIQETEGSFIMSGRKSHSAVDDRLPACLLWLAAAVTISVGLTAALAASGHASKILYLFVLASMIVAWLCCVAALCVVVLSRFNHRIHKRSTQAITKSMLEMEEQLVERVDRLEHAIAQMINNKVMVNAYPETALPRGGQDNIRPIRTM